MANLEALLYDDHDWDNISPSTSSTSLPPDYSDGANIQPVEVEDLKSVNATIYDGRTVILTFIDQDLSVPLDTGDTITGKVVVIPNRDTEFDYIPIDLIMDEKFKIPQLWASYRYITKTYILGRYRIPPAAYPEGKVLKHGYKYTFTYSLTLPDSLCDVLKDTTSLYPHYQLPSTLGTIDGLCLDEFDVSGKRLAVTYQIRSRIYKRGDNIQSRLAETRRLITVIPSHPPCMEAYAPSPDDDSGACLYNYTVKCLATSKKLSLISLKKNKYSQMRTCSMGDLSMAIKYTPALYRRGKSVSNVILDLKYTPVSITNDIFPQIQKVYYKLLGFVTTSPDPLDYYPKLSDCKRECSGYDEFPTQATTFSVIKNWREDNTSTVKIPLSLPADGPQRKLVPTFFTTTCSRQYVIQMVIWFDNSLCATLTFPVVVANRFYT